MTEERRMNRRTFIENVRVSAIGSVLGCAAPLGIAGGLAASDLQNQINDLKRKVERLEMEKDIADERIEVLWNDLSETRIQWHKEVSYLKAQLADDSVCHSTQSRLAADYESEWADVCVDSYTANLAMTSTL